MADKQGGPSAICGTSVYGLACTNTTASSAPPADECHGVLSVDAGTLRLVLWLWNVVVRAQLSLLPNSTLIIRLQVDLSSFLSI